MSINAIFSYSIQGVCFVSLSALWFPEGGAYADLCLDFLVFLHYRMYSVNCFGDESEKVLRKSGDMPPHASKPEQEVERGKEVSAEQ